MKGILPRKNSCFMMESDSQCHQSDDTLRAVNKEKEGTFRWRMASGYNSQWITTKWLHPFELLLDTCNALYTLGYSSQVFWTRFAGSLPPLQIIIMYSISAFLVEVYPIPIHRNKLLRDRSTSKTNSFQTAVKEYPDPESPKIFIINLFTEKQHEAWYE